VCRIIALMDWLGDSARVALQKSNVTSASLSSEDTDRYHAVPPQSSCIGLPAPAATHVHTIAAILWHNHEQIENFDISDIITTELFRYEHHVCCDYLCTVQYVNSCLRVCHYLSYGNDNNDSSRLITVTTEKQ